MDGLLTVEELREFVESGRDGAVEEHAYSILEMVEAAQARVAELEELFESWRRAFRSVASRQIFCVPGQPRVSADEGCPGRARPCETCLLCWERWAGAPEPLASAADTVAAN